MDKNIKKCEHCKKDINTKKEKYVLLGTYDKKKTLSEALFHFNCFVVWYNSKVKEKAQNEIKEATQRAMGMFKNILGGNDQMMQMFPQGKDINFSIETNIPLQTALKKQLVVRKEKKNDGKRKIKMLKV